MSEVELKSGYFNAEDASNPDRVYSASDLNDYFKGLVSSSGIFLNVDGACAVLAGTGLSVVVSSGKGMVDNHWFKIEAETSLNLTAADVILNRIDRIVVRCDNANRKVYLAVLTGALAETPIVPSLTRNSEIYEISLGSIYVGKNQTTITNSNITDERPNNNVCGWISGLINQIDTTTLFLQYEAAQAEFIDSQTVEFENWFENIQDQVKATSLYREYSSLYKTTASNVKTITIPTSINFVNNSLDVLTVYVNGRIFVKDVDYTMNSAGTSITLKLPLAVIGTEIYFVNKKSVQDAVAENVVVQVEQLEQEVAELQTKDSNYYIAKGEDDNIVLSNMVKNFLNGTGDYSTAADNASLTIYVTGKLKISTALIENQMMFDFHNSVASNRKLIIDFGAATIPDYTINNIDSLIAMFGSNDNVTIRNANIKITNPKAKTLYIFHGGVIKDCTVKVINDHSYNVYGAWATTELTGCSFDIESYRGSGYDSYNYVGAYQCERVQFSNIIMKLTSDSISATKYSIKMTGGFLIGNKLVGTVSKSNSTVDIGNLVS